MNRYVKITITTSAEPEPENRPTEYYEDEQVSAIYDVDLEQPAEVEGVHEDIDDHLLGLMSEYEESTETA